MALAGGSGLQNQLNETRRLWVKPRTKEYPGRGLPMPTHLFPLETQSFAVT